MKPTKQLIKKKSKIGTPTKKVTGVSASEKLFKKIDAQIKTARKKGDVKELVVLSTTRNHYNKNLGQHGFGAEDLKKSYKELYKKLLVKHDVFTKPVNIGNHEVNWVVSLK